MNKEEEELTYVTLGERRKETLMKAVGTQQNFEWSDAVGEGLRSCHVNGDGVVDYVVGHLRW